MVLRMPQSYPWLSHSECIWIIHSNAGSLNNILCSSHHHLSHFLSDADDAEHPPAYGGHKHDEVQATQDGFDTQANVAGMILHVDCPSYFWEIS